MYLLVVAYADVPVEFDVSGCYFGGNNAESECNILGGVVALDRLMLRVFVRCVIVGHGGALAIDVRGIAANCQMDVAIEDSEFVGNVANFNGGAVHVGTSDLTSGTNGSVMVRNVTMFANSAMSGTGGGVAATIHEAHEFTLAVTDTWVDLNTAAGSGGGMYVSVLGPSGVCDIVFGNNQFSENEASAGEGGGLWLGFAKLVRALDDGVATLIDSSDFTSNIAQGVLVFMVCDALLRHCSCIAATAT